MPCFGIVAVYLCLMTTYYYSTIEEALRQARLSARRPGRHYGGITLPSGRRGFAVYEGTTVVERYSYHSQRAKSMHE